ncbi:ABC transporter substrate-binding protein [uncultured Methylobacterium sp.]|uniref:ABC transporter substrate-binding protein n=1 Tax=uncultured Methylobacterium sp. TaxID=157278 RepID=UPI0035CC877F
MDQNPLTRRNLMLGGAALGALGPISGSPAFAQTSAAPVAGGAPSGSLTYGISMTDLPLTTGQPDKGAGGYQFTGLTLYDPLVAWELDVADRPGKLIPGLATGWESDPADRKLWTFRLRDGVTFHDGSAFDADAVIWNFDKVLNKEAPHFDQRQAAQVRPRLPGVASYRKRDAMTVQVTTKAADSLFPYQMLWFLISSPAQFEALGRDWSKFAFQPSGTGPYKMGQLQPRVRLELVANEAHWNPKRMPKLAKLTLSCVPEDLARVNALLSGSVDLIELPAPDAVPRLKAAGMRIVGNDTPHVWNYHLSMLEGSPWRDLRLRKAANLAIDRDGVVQLMGGLAAPALGQVQTSNPWFGKPKFQIKTDVEAARKLVEEAGYSVKNPVKATIVIPTGGTGQMLSLPINEFIQQSWAEVGIQVEFRTVELEVAYTGWRQGAADPSLKGVTAGNIAYVTSDPFYAILRFYDSKQIAPNGVNWSHYRNPEVDALCDQVKASLDLAEQDRLLARIHEIVVDDAVQVWVVHDTNPHALSPRVKRYTQAQHWFQDLSTLA